MCGIAGLIRSESLNEGDATLVSGLVASMVHRGPDGEGHFSDRGVCLGMRRLSIIDLTGGWQPLYNEDRSLALVCNGEVYNHVELRATLRARGHRFATGSDCETALHLYEDHGLDFVHHLRGMYAIALWDSRRKRLVIVRDRMGEKPLYLHESNGRVVFASELRAMLRAGVVPFQLDPGAVNLYYHYNYVPEPRTAVLGVRKLPAGHMLVVDTDPWRVEQRRYWSIDDAPPVEGDPATVIRERLDEIGRLIVRSDVPVGVALSGGLDSSVVAAIAARQSPGQIHALTVGYEGRPHQDERSQASELAESLGMPFHQVEVRTSDVVDRFPDLVGWRDDPINDIAGHGYWAISDLARSKGIPVLLKGHGGDELFWGYDWVKRALARSRAKQRGGLANAGARLRDLGAFVPRGFDRNSVRRVAIAWGGLAHGWRPVFPGRRGTPDQLVFYDLAGEFQTGVHAARRIFGDAFARRAREADPREPFRVARPWPDLGVLFTRLISETYLVENGMAQGDRLSMASSVELRLPLCDYKLVETVVGLRRTRPDDADEAKVWLKATARGLIPARIMDRPKRGFSPPGRVWMHALAERYAARIPDGYLVGSGVIKPEAASRLCRPHSRLSSWENTFMKTLMLEYWCRAMQAMTRPQTTPRSEARHESIRTQATA